MKGVFFTDTGITRPAIANIELLREEQCRAMKGGQTTQKANIYLGDVWTSQSEQFLVFPLVRNH